MYHDKCEIHEFGNGGREIIPTHGFCTTEVLGGMTGSKLLSVARDSARARDRGETISPLSQSRIDFAVEVYGPEQFYMDGELFTPEQYR